VTGNFGCAERSLDGRTTMRTLIIAALLLPIAAYAQSPPSNAASGSGTPIGPPPSPAVPPPSNQTGQPLPLGPGASSSPTGALPAPVTTVPEK
jgi:hypothetical protein